MHTVIAEAVRLGYERLVLDTLEEMTVARRLYETFGFRETRPYAVNPLPGAHLLEWWLTVQPDHTGRANKAEPPDG